MNPIDVDNDINVVIKSKTDGVLFDENCCTVINIILTNEGKIANTFLGIHNEYLVKHLEKAQKMYMKALKKTLKEERIKAKNIAEDENSNENIDSNTDVPKEDDTLANFEKSNKESTQNTDTTLSQSKKKKSTKKEESTQQASSQVVSTDTQEEVHKCSKSGKRLVKQRIAKNK